MPYNSVADSFHTKKLCRRLFNRSVMLDGKGHICGFEPPFQGFGATYDVHLRLIGKRLVDFLLGLIGLFLSATTEALRANID